MNERLLHFIWQFQYFDFRNLIGENEESIQIVHPGYLNTHQGPDFLEAKIKIDDTLLAGSVEIHVKSSDWRQHKHSGDKNYNNVVLHVVWENDATLHENFSTLCLQSRVSVLLLQKYESLLQKQYFVPCQEYLPYLSSLGWLHWMERVGIERLEKKARSIIILLQENQGHWKEIFWQLLARNFGLKVNAEIFFEMAKILKISMLVKHKNQIHQLEAMLLGTVNLIPEETDDAYVKILQREYSLLRHKFSLKKLTATPLFLRMRPATFPSVRLAQLAMLIHRSSHLFSRVMEADSLEEIKSLFSIQANDYWHYHYRLGDEGVSFLPKKLGKAAIENIIVNTIAPAVFAYGFYYEKQLYKDKALAWLQQLSAEKNSVIEGWKKYGVKPANALESQALIELKSHYCDYKFCLRCAVGKAILAEK